MTRAAMGRIAWGLFALCVVVAALATRAVLARERVEALVSLWGPLALGALLLFQASRDARRGPEVYERSQAIVLGFVGVIGVVVYGLLFGYALGWDHLLRAWGIVFFSLWFLMGFFLREREGATAPEDAFSAFVFRHRRRGYFALTGLALLQAIFNRNPVMGFPMLAGLALFMPGLPLPSQAHEADAEPEFTPTIVRESE